MRLRSLAAALLVSVSLLAACGSSGSDEATGDTTVGTETTAASESFNEADVAFAQNMIPHHQQAVEMAVIALDEARNASAEVKDLAQRIQGAQQPEIDIMTGWLTAWGKEVMPDMDGMDHSSMGGMEGMMTAEQMTALERATGPAFDAAWMEMMIEHHKGAVAMSKTVEADGSNADVRDLAGKIVAAQEAEIAEMTATLGK